jgi:hypothetical protein
LARIAQQLLGAQLNKFEMRCDGLPFMRRKRAQQMIAVQVGLKGQHDFLSPGLCALRCIFPVRFKFRERIYWRSSKYVATSPVARYCRRFDSVWRLFLCFVIHKREPCQHPQTPYQ